MTVPTGTPGDEVPEADWAEQATEAGPVDEGAAHPVGWVVPGGSREADEADLADQELAVDYDEDDQ
jgi:hypothetical protein